MFPKSFLTLIIHNYPPHMLHGWTCVIWKNENIHVEYIYGLNVKHELVGWCMRAPCFDLLVIRDPPSPRM